MYSSTMFFTNTLLVSFIALIVILVGGNEVPETQIVVRRGGRANLPCDISIPTVVAPTPGVRTDNQLDSIDLIIWYKDESGLPVYTIDARRTSLSRARTWANERILGTRSSFIFRTNPAYLSIDNAEVSDAGIYRCRVDYRNSPTRNHNIMLQIN